MFMRYLGGGIGHKGNMTSTLAAALDNLADPEDVNDEAADYTQPVNDEFSDKEIEYGYVAEQDDAGDDSDQQESGSDLDQEEDGDLGPEEGHEVDAYDDYEFAPL